MIKSRGTVRSFEVSGIKNDCRRQQFSRYLQRQRSTSRYSGPRFSDTDWNHMAGKDGVQPRGTAQEDGYNYIVACYDKGRYTIYAGPLLPKGNGTLSLCADQSGQPTCGIGTDLYGRRVCKPCER